ncbi:ZFY27 protein, partial [Polypterus senegalus]
MLQVADDDLPAALPGVAKVLPFAPEALRTSLAGSSAILPGVAEVTVLQVPRGLRRWPRVPTGQNLFASLPWSSSNPGQLLPRDPEAIHVHFRSFQASRPVYSSCDLFFRENMDHSPGSFEEAEEAEPDDEFKDAIEEDDDVPPGVGDLDLGMADNGLLSRNEPIRSKVSKLTEKLRKRYPANNYGT